MITRIATFWERLRGTFWFLPAILIVTAVLLSFAMIELDQRISFEDRDDLRWFGTTSPEGARSFLSTVAGSMISVAGVTFSITLVALSQTSSQYGPRLISNFLRDRGNQIVLGTFIATFVYCLLVSRTIRGTDEFAFVPSISMMVGMGLALLSVGVLVYFIHHISVSLQAEHIISVIKHDLERAIERLYPDEGSANSFEHQLRDAGDLPDDFDDKASAITSSKSGYVQAIDYDSLEKTAVEHDLVMRLSCRAGNFIAKDDDLLAVWPQDRLSDDVNEHIHDAFILGSQRLHGQDIEFAIHQLVEIAVRSLSTGINDPFTAIACIDQLSSSLGDLAERTIPGGYHYDDDGRLRVIRNVVSFSGLVNIAFNKIAATGEPVWMSLFGCWRR